LKSFKDIVRLSGLDPEKLVANWETNIRALKTWLGTGDLLGVALEVFNPKTGSLIIRWDVDVVYGWSSGDGNFWTDTEQLRYHIQKAGVAPADARYDILLHTKAGRPDIAGWGTGAYRSTDGFVRHSLGTTIEHSGLGGNAAYWRRTN